MNGVLYGASRQRKETRGGALTRDLRVQPYEYPATAWGGYPQGMAEMFQDVSDATESEHDANTASEPATIRPVETDPALIEQEFKRRLAEEAHKGEERGLSRGVDLGHSRAREEAVQQAAGERERLQAQAAALLVSYARDRELYFQRAEEEAVRLALAIAARILRREAQMDPLLLTGAVRVALGQLAASTSVRLHVPAQDAELWEEALKHLPGLASPPAVVADERMELGDCRMDTELGSADLGLKAQLREIERGFFDRVGVAGRSAGQNGTRQNEATREKASEAVSGVHELISSRGEP